MAEQERVDAPDTDQIPAQTAKPTQPAQRESARGDVAPGEPAQYEPNTGMPDPAVVPTPDHAFKKMRRTRFSGLWVGLTAAAIVLLVLLVFIIENSQSVNISFFGAHGHLSLGVALLLAAIAGVLLVAVPGYGRILQLRRALRRSATK
ncbi:MAG TPA: lipopolysaccharide assembly protein LapA domain-containing protein [Pseudonocardiaceae bacterium]|nr:lipopolysaccharide assembly protein LapA domain-containing protein [Pseudonocardiaceae bacterium]